MKQNLTLCVHICKYTACFHNVHNDSVWHTVSQLNFFTQILKVRETHMDVCDRGGTLKLLVNRVDRSRTTKNGNINRYKSIYKVF